LSQAWLSLLAPLPADAKPERKPLATPGSEGAAPDSPIAGWQDLILDLSDVPFGHRIVSVVLDATGQPIAASDHVVLRAVDASGRAPDGPVRMRQESVGGRIESDGTFRGTHWIIEGPEPAGDEEPAWPQTPRPPTDEEGARLLEIVREVVARAR
jgi:hypothetical protein